MDNMNALITLWQSQKKPEVEATKTILSQENNNVMEAIIQFENKEKSDKNKQKAAAVVLAVLTAYLLYNVQLTPYHFVGLILLIVGIAFSIIANRTDNFPDIRQLNTLDYLKTYKANTVKRTKMHVINSILGGLFVLPGLYFTFRTSFLELGNWWIPIMLISAMIPLVMWFKEYNKRSKLVLEKVSKLIHEFEEETADNPV